MTTYADTTIRAARSPLPLAAATAMIRKSIHEFCSDPGRKSSPGRLITFRTELEPLDTLAWLHNQNTYPRLFWMNRDHTDSVAGIGAADSISCDNNAPNSESFSFLQKTLENKNIAARYFGGCCFNNLQRRDASWAPFTSLYFILPKLQVTSSYGRQELSCHLVLQEGRSLRQSCQDLLDSLDRMQLESSAPDAVIPQPATISYLPNRKEWIERCNDVLQTFSEGFVAKIILARQTSLTFSERFSPLLFMLRYPFPESSTYRYYLEPEEGKAFFSFTPERLYHRHNNSLVTEALAGTCSRERGATDGTTACDHLLNSEKDIREHSFVKNTIADELASICTTIEMENEARALQLNNLVHLYTRCTATLRHDAARDATILETLHPTPAVGGVPKEEALKHIMHLEPFSRGWYAGPVGWISPDKAEFAVGIRSALADGRVVHLFSGAGLVKGSDPSMEWQEVDHKIADMLAMTGCPAYTSGEKSDPSYEAL
ncbi:MULTISPECIES: isochorismate synthase [Prosthecochloris]|uniref:Isochorismate synthase MenF n=1 Tax=Prosthecochloris vibrioformis TaxID=1098 RepID=A0A5C4S4A0_PROVB|nr:MULTISPECIES: isochorismate synthase [Prosthecochloris]ANT65695.1 Menaquinone-specific isochorismate synthase [Prosthecochloris sp. CIB 2401]TNJ37929.1 isochorismate synthase [Prosthecochloris vibrioformis]